MFHAWRSFSFDENTETIDTYITCIKQVATFLDYGEPQTSGVFKNTLPTKLYWILFPIEDLRQVVETAKRILTKKTINRQISGQSSSTLFMSIRDSHNKNVSFDTKEELGDKIDKLVVMIGKVATRDSGTGRQFKPHIHQGRGRGQTEVTMTDVVMIIEAIRTDTGQIVETEDSRERIQVGLGKNKFIGEVTSEIM